jgi:hypothetical protein
LCRILGILNFGEIFFRFDLCMKFICQINIHFVTTAIVFLEEYTRGLVRVHKPVLSDFFTIFQTYDDFLFLEATWAHGKVKIKSNLSATFILCAQRNIDFGFDVLFVKFNLEKCRIVVQGFTDIYSKQISDLFSVLKYKDAKFKHDTASCLGLRIIERNTD